MMRELDTDINEGQAVTDEAILHAEELFDAAVKEVLSDFGGERRKTVYECQVLIAGFMVASAISYGAKMIAAAILADRD